MTEKQAQEYAEALAAKMERLSYPQLLDLARARSVDPNALCGLEGTPGDDPYVGITVVQGGRIRKRICVEIIVTSKDGSEEWNRPGLIYFERYPSGKIYRGSSWEVFFFCTLLIVGGATVLTMLIRTAVRFWP